MPPPWHAGDEWWIVTVQYQTKRSRLNMNIVLRRIIQMPHRVICSFSSGYYLIFSASRRYQSVIDSSAWSQTISQGSSDSRGGLRPFIMTVSCHSVTGLRDNHLSVSLAGPKTSTPLGNANKVASRGGAIRVRGIRVGWDSQGWDNRVGWMR